MGSWKGKYVIGLTGNIGTGKSVVRKMLEHLGAYGIDADALAHRVIAKGAPGFTPVLDYFGKWVLDAEGQIDRAKLGRVVFADPKALTALEAIIHPFVQQAVAILVQRASQPVIVIEAIKLLESEMRQACDTLWVTHTTQKTQLARLVKKRGMSVDEARLRITSQPSQAEKLAAADTVIQNEGSFEDTWWQVVAAWKTISPAEETGPTRVAPTGALAVQRARPQMAAEIAAFINRFKKGSPPLTNADIMEAFGEKAFMLLVRDGAVVGLVGWQVENLVTRTTDFYLEPGLSLAEAAPALMKEVEAASGELQSEASLLFVPQALANQPEIWKALGYEPRTLEALYVRAWQEAARESAVRGTVLLFKQLRVDRVLRPI